MATLRFTDTAEADVEAIADHIRADNPQAAWRLVVRIEEKCRLLATRPGIGRARANLQPDLRSHAVERYVVFYRPIADGIEVVRILHGARDVDAAFAPCDALIGDPD